MGFEEKSEIILSDIGKNTTEKRKSLNKATITKVTVVALAGIFVCVFLILSSGNKNTLSGSWTFSRFVSERYGYEESEYYRGIIIDSSPRTTIGTIHFNKNGTFIAECYEIDYSDSEITEKKIKGEYEYDGVTLTLTWGTSDEIELEVKEKGSNLVLMPEGGYGLYYYE